MVAAGVVDPRRQTRQRAGNALRRLLAGLPPSGRTLSPEVRDDLFEAHRSLYLFAAGLAAGARVLDLGCGTGYGAAELARGDRQGKPREVVGVDRHAPSLRYARRHFPGIDFRRGDAEALPEDLGRFDLIVALGLLPHLVHRSQALTGIASRLAPGGRFLASLPPILDGQALALHQARPDTPSALYLWDWEEELHGTFRSLRLFRHLPPQGRLPDFADPGPATVAATEYRCEEIPLTEIYDVGSLTALFYCTN